MMNYGNFSIWVGLTLSCAMLFGCAEKPNRAQRFGSVIGIEREHIEEYKRLHAEAWPGVLEIIKECNIRHYSIYLTELDDGKYYLFSHFEYTGDDFEGDMEKMKADPTTQRWWKQTDPLQTPVSTRKEDEWWHRMEEVFHQE